MNTEIRYEQRLSKKMSIFLNQMEVLIDECVFGTAGTFDYIVGGFDQVRFNINLTSKNMNETFRRGLN